MSAKLINIGSRFLRNFERIVADIIELKKLNLETDSLENRLNTMVYKLYGISYLEVLIIEPNFWMTESEFENFKI